MKIKSEYLRDPGEARENEKVGVGGSLWFMLSHNFTENEQLINEQTARGVFKADRFNILTKHKPSAIPPFSVWSLRDCEWWGKLNS